MDERLSAFEAAELERFLALARMDPRIMASYRAALLIVAGPLPEADTTPRERLTAARRAER